MAIVLLITMSCIETCEESVKRIYLEQNFCGIVDTIILNPREQKVPYCIINYQNITIRNHIIHDISKGDTLFKHANSMKYYWIKNGDTTIFYQKCGHSSWDEVRDINPSVRNIP
ncbi:MAG: hypothetical protein JNM44_03880 [Chitinophagaceae bacterium]|nr:hypothetical protein [Chitinophagaceae bacterium]